MKTVPKAILDTDILSAIMRQNPHKNEEKTVKSISINQFINNIQDFVKYVINQHIPLKITDQNGEDFVIISAEDWEQQQETLFVLQNRQLMKQINDSLSTHTQNKGYSPNQEELDEILNI